MSQDSRIGTEIAGYRIESVLGRGGMSVVYLAAQEFPKRKVALKLLAPELADEPGFRERFVRESNAAASLDHPNVIPIYGAGEHDGVLWIAMRYVDGTDLAHLIRDAGPLPAERTVRIVEQVASALDAAHEIGLVHRDVKPGNVLLARSDHAYLCDFGIIKRRDAGTEFTKTGDFLGTVDYAAPEQIRGEPVDGRADVYSLGCVIFECLTGKPPYSREADLAVAYAHVNDPPPRPTDVRPELPAAIDEVIARAMAKRPERRSPTAGELARGVREALAPAGRPASPGRRRTVALVAGAVVVAVALLVVAITALVPRGSGAASQTPSAGTSTAGPQSPGASSTGTPAGASSPSSGVPATFTGVLRIDPGTGDVVARVPTGGTFVDTGQVRSIALTAAAVWFAAGTTGAKINPAENVVVNGSVPGLHSPIVSDPSTVWTLEQAISRVTLVGLDERTNEVRHRIHIPVDPGFSGAVNPFPLATGAGSVWLIMPKAGTHVVFRVDQNQDRIAKTIPLPPQVVPTAVAFGMGRLWFVDSISGTVRSIDPRTNRLAGPPITMPGNPTDLAVRAGALWVIDRGAGKLYEYPIGAGAGITTIAVGKDPVSIAVGERAVWVVNHGDGTLSEVDPGSGDVTATIPLSSGFDCSGDQVFICQGIFDVSAARGVVWVAEAGG